jgi:hypothetical protein
VHRDASRRFPAVCFFATCGGDNAKSKDDHMALTPARKGSGALTRADIEGAGVKPDDIRKSTIELSIAPPVRRDCSSPAGK